MSGKSNRGVSLVEVLIGAMGLLLVVTLALRTFAELAVQTEAQRVRASRVQSARIARSVLRAELAESNGPGDATFYPPDSARLRAFRGLALVCPGTASDSVVDVRWMGRRAPQPAKDSVRALMPDGSWTSADLVRVAGARHGCGGGGGITSAWMLRPELPDAVLLRLFESASYHLSDGALRYRSGRSGRQPLTESALGRAGIETSGDVVVGEWSVLASGERTRLYLGRVRVPQ